MAPDTVLYDDLCPLCRNLAALAARRAGEGLAFQSWQEFQASPAGRERLPDAVREQPADRLRVLAGSELLEGAAAWEFLLGRYKDLAALNWLAERTGLRQPVATGMQRVGSIVRRMCLKCPKEG